MKDFIKKIQENPIKQGIPQEIEDVFMPSKGCNCSDVKIVKPIKSKKK